MVNDKLKQTIREAVREGIEEALTKYGIDTSSPNSMQSDMVYLRKSREGSEELARWIKRSAITVAISSILAAIWGAFKQAINGDLK
jgi:hypothetical protein